MKIWIAKNSEVPVREQLVAQITLAIAAADYDVGQRLPSTREIARRCGIHANTVSSAYHRLAAQGLIEYRKGSGFFVAEAAAEQLDVTRRFDDLLRKFLESAKVLGFGEDEIIRRLKQTRVSGATGGVTVVESDTGLREILVHELSAIFPEVVGISWEELSSGVGEKSEILAAMFDEKPKVESALRHGQKYCFLKGRSVAAAMSGESRPRDGEVVAVVSGWDGFLSFARIMLLAAKVDPGQLIVRSTADDDWRSAIKRASLIICDSLTAIQLDGHKGVRPFRVIADESITELAGLLHLPLVS